MSKVGIIDYEKLVDGTKLMYNNTNLTSVKCPFPVLKNGCYMFCGCNALTNVSIPDLSSLQNGYMMFYKTRLQNFSCDLPSLKNGDTMFMNYNQATPANFSETAKLVSFNGDLGELVDGKSLFSQQSKFTTFSTSSLQNLKSGIDMFYRTSLNLNSVKQIADNIRDIRDLNRNTDSDWSYQIDGEEETIIDKSDRGIITINGWFPVGYEDSIKVQKELEKITDKGWYVDRWAGNATTSIYEINFYNEKTHNIVIQKYTNNKWQDVLNTDVTFLTSRRQGKVNDKVVTWDTEGVGTNSLEFEPFSWGRPDVGFIEENKTREECEYWKDDGTCSGNNAIILSMIHNDSGVQVDFYVETQKASGMTVEARKTIFHKSSVKLKVLIDGNVIAMSS